MAPQKQTKLARRDKEVHKKLYGEKVMLINMSDEDKFCASTGAKLPKHGMVVKYENNYYSNWGASERAATNNNPS